MATNWHWLILLIWAAVAQNSLAVDKGNFKTCDQSAFCRRQRATQPGTSAWEVLLDSLNATVNSLQVEVINSRNLAQLQLQIIALADSTIRIQLDEQGLARPRYRVVHSLAAEPTLSSLNIVEQSAQSVSVSFGKNGRAVLLAKPFRLDVYEGDQLVVSINARGLLNFENQRVRKSGEASQPEENAPEGDSTAAEPSAASTAPEAATGTEEASEDEPGMWEETFKSHTDSKPYGPTSVGVDISFPGSRFVYGIPEHADDFALKVTKGMDPYRLYNTDVFEYELSSPMALYGAVPFMVAKNQNGATGVFWNNAAEMWVDISDSTGGSVVSSLMNLVSGGSGSETHKETHWFSESGIIDLFVMTGPTPKDVNRQYSALTGTTPLPQRFALGYHQCRWNYNDQEDVHNVDKGFDHHDIPYDVLWLDIEHTDNKQYFTWDSVKFPEPLEMVKNLTGKGRKLVTIVDPHMKRDSNYFFHQECERSDFYVKNKDGKIYEGWCWPGAASYPDFFNPAVRDYWASRYALDKYDGTTVDVYTWNDMNEPSVFNGPEVTMPKDCIHYDGYEHRDVHNLYGMMVVEGTIRGQLMRSNYKLRPFVLSRSFFAGSQRFGAVWTGDNMAEWGHLAVAVPMLLSLSVSGIPFCGADVGGFFNNPDSELIARWYQAGAFQPFFRGHAHLHSKRREPWLFDQRTNQLIKASIKRRYSYLPLWYTLFHEHETTGVPPMRPLWMEYPEDQDTFAIENQHFLGDALLVHPVVELGVTSVRVYFPGQNTQWYDIDTYQVHYGAGYETVDVTIDKIPVFQRGGSIVAKKERARRSSSQMANDPYTLVVTLDRQGKAQGRLYVDDGQSLDYQKGAYRLIEFQMDGNVLSSKFIGDGQFQSDEWIERIIIAGYNQTPTRVVQSDGTVLEHQYHDGKKLLILRKPSLPVTKQEWSLTIH